MLIHPAVTALIHARLPNKYRRDVITTPTGTQKIQHHLGYGVIPLENARKDRSLCVPNCAYPSHEGRYRRKYIDQLH